jgi:hypothetical protein
VIGHRGVVDGIRAGIISALFRMWWCGSFKGCGRQKLGLEAYRPRNPHYQARVYTVGRRRGVEEVGSVVTCCARATTYLEPGSGGWTTCSPTDSTFEKGKEGGNGRSKKHTERSIQNEADIRKQR